MQTDQSAETTNMADISYLELLQRLNLLVFNPSDAAFRYKPYFSKSGDILQIQRNIF